MVYAKTFTTFARHAFSKTSFVGHVYGSPSGGAATSFFSQNFVAPSRGPVAQTHQAITQRFYSQFGANAGRNNPNTSQGGENYGTGQNFITPACSSDDGSKEREWRSQQRNFTSRFASSQFPSLMTQKPSPDEVPAGNRTYSTQAGHEISPDDLSPTERENYTPQSSILLDPVFEPDLRDAEIYEAKVTNLMETGQFNSVHSVYLDMKANGVVPTVRLYSLILQSLSRSRAQGPTTKILETYTDMLQNKILPDAAIYSTVIEALCARSVEVKSILQQADSNALQDKNLVDKLREENNVVTAFNVFKSSMTVLDQPFAARTYNAMMEALAANDMVEELLQVYESLETSTTTPDAATFVTLISAFGNFGDLRAAIECYNEYKVQFNKLPPHDENAIYEALIGAYFANDNSSGAIEFFTKICKVPNKYPSARLLNAIVLGLSHSEDLHGALKWVERMQSTLGLPNPTQQTVAPILLAAARKGDVSVAKDAFVLGGPILSAYSLGDTSALMAFITLCAQRGNIEEAESAVGMLLKGRVIPNVSCSQVFISSLVRNDQVPKAVAYLLDVIDIHSMHGSTPVSDFQFESLLSVVIGELESAIIEDFAIARQIIAILHSLPQLFSQEPSIVARTLIFSYAKARQRNIPFDPPLNGIEMAGLIKFQAAVTVSNSSNSDDESMLSGLICSIGPSDWVYLSRACQQITEHLNRLQNTELRQLWQDILTSLDMGSQVASESAHSLSPVSSTSQDTPTTIIGDVTSPMEPTNISPPSSAGTPMQFPSLRRLPTFYSLRHKAAPGFDIAQSDNLIRTLTRMRFPDKLQLEKVLLIMRNTRRNGRRLLPEVLGKLIYLAGKAHRVDIVVEAFEFALATVREVNPAIEDAFNDWCVILNNMIIAHAFNNDFNAARFFHNQLVEMGVAPDADAFAAYIVNLKSLDSNDEATEALIIFHEARALGVIPSTFLYNTLISKLARARRTDDALYYFQDMRANGIETSSVTYGTVINACCRIGNEALAIRYFHEMETSKNFNARIAPYNTMLQFYVQSQEDRSKALSFYEKMRAQLITPSAHTYKLLMDAYSTLEPIDIRAAEGVLDIIHEDRQRPTSVHFAALIHAHGSGGRDLATATKWFTRVIDPSYKWAVVPDEALYQALIEAHVANHEVSSCQWILDHMMNNNIKLTVYMANHLIDGWAQEGNLANARAVFDILDKEKHGQYGREPSTYEAMTRAYLAVGDVIGAEGLVKEMSTKGYPDPVVARVAELLLGAESYRGSGGEPSTANHLSAAASAAGSDSPFSIEMAA